jgi:hypothetical protein
MRACSFVVLFLIASSASWGGEEAVAVEVGHLIDTVAESGCKFVRNGKEHTAGEAADHLQMKARKGKRYYDTTEEFIDRIASKSSWSGKPYLIQCAGKPAVKAGNWFTQVLAEYRTTTPGANQAG